MKTTISLIITTVMFFTALLVYAENKDTNKTGDHNFQKDMESLFNLSKKSGDIEPLITAIRLLSDKVSSTDREIVDLKRIYSESADMKFKFDMQTIKVDKMEKQNQENSDVIERLKNEIEKNERETSYLKNELEQLRMKINLGIH